MFVSLLIPNAFGPITAVLSLLLLFGAYGLWQLEAWGWALVGVLYLGGVLFNLGSGGVSDGQDLFRLVLSVTILAYLYRQRSRYLSDERPRRKPEGRPRGESRE